MTSKKIERFTKIPNEYIRGNISTRFGVSRKFYIVYILIDRYRTYEDFSWITIHEVLNFYGYKTTSRKPKSFKEILDVLRYMINNKMIKVNQDLDSIGYDTGIKIKIITENFDCITNFAKITSSQLDSIIMGESNVSKESILMTFLYINSYIGCRSIGCKNPQDNPNAFYGSVENMVKELAMSKSTVYQCLEYLATSTDFKKSLLVKKEVGSVHFDKTNQLKNIPNIYVLNEDGYEQEIEWALKKC